MRVRINETLWPFDDLEGINTDNTISTFLSEDIWKNFEFDESLTELTTPLDEDLELDAMLELSLDATVSEIRHHDCMWAGYCGSKEHKPESIKIAPPLLQVTYPPVQIQPKRPLVTQPHTQNSSRSLLLNSRNNITQSMQTPSDSEEEIDVVSVGEKQLTTNRNCTVLPTNPSIRDRQKLQRSVASAISNKREFVVPTTGGIKTRLPLRLPNTSSSNNTSGAKKRGGGGGVDGRLGVKRGRYRYGKSGGFPAKRRGSDSETECSEKRNLRNIMERQRRVDLRNAFDDLRVLVPEVSCKERATRVVILREAATYCNRLRAESMQHQKHVTELRRQQERLHARVPQLRRSLAAKR